MKTKNQSFYTLFLFFFLSFLSACAQQEMGAAKLAKNSVERLGCSHFEGKLWDDVYDIMLSYAAAVDEDEGLSEEERAKKFSQFQFPSGEEFQEQLRARLKDRKWSEAQLPKLPRLEQELTQLYNLITKEAPSSFRTKDVNQILRSLSALELGDRTTDVKAKLQTKLDKQFSKVRQAVKDLSPNCVAPLQVRPSAPYEGAFLTELKASLEPAVYGAWKTIGTAYQSCRVFDLAPMGASSAPVEGISVVGKHSSGRGLKREITNLGRVQKTHRYIKDVQYDSIAIQNGCFDTYSRPLIYDFGGKPFPSTSSDTLDFFRNSGSGSKDLGTDCSGFVFTALATAGLKLRSDQSLKASSVLGVSANMLRLPESNGLSCLDRITVNKDESLRPGDIIATTGHVVMVDEIGLDPFGIQNITKESDCRAGAIAAENFNFTIVQSSPSKGAIGINRMIASDYLAGSGSMRRGLVDYAIEACKAKFRGPRRPKVNAASVVRHKGTPSCLDEPLVLERQSCLNTCSL